MDRLKAIFERQLELHDKFLPIHEASGLGLRCIAGEEPYDINDQKFQFMVKSYAWYVVEELAEAIEAQGQDHLHEELADMLHFFIELCLIIGIDPYQLIGVEPYSDGAVDLLELWWIKSPEYDEANMQILTYQFIKRFGIAMECLKNKPWKQTMVEVDHRKFIENIQLAGFAMVGIFKFHGISSEQMAAAYFGKASENDSRIRRGR